MRWTVSIRTGRLTWQSYESLIESAQSDAKKTIEGQISSVPADAETMEENQSANRLPDVKNFDKEVLLAQEKEMLGVYLTEHPSAEYEAVIERSAPSRLRIWRR